MKALALWLASACAVAYLALMAWTGAFPERAQHVKFEARGLLAEDPTRVDAVDLGVDGGTRRLVRAGAGWQEGGQPLPAAAAEALESALKFMRNSEPVRAIPLAEIRGQDPKEFGLVPPRLTLRIEVGGAAALEAGFGATSANGRLDYVGVQGRDRLFMLSHFVFEEWQKFLALPAPEKR